MFSATALGVFSMHPVAAMAALDFTFTAPADIQHFTIAGAAGTSNLTTAALGCAGSPSKVTAAVSVLPGTYAVTISVV